MRLVASAKKNGLRKKAKRLVEKNGLIATAKRFDIAPNTLARYCHGMDVHKSTEKMIELGVLGSQRTPLR